MPEADIEEMIEALCELDSEEYSLSDWEVEFIESMSKKFEKEGDENFTDSQKTKLTQIYEKAFK